MTEWLGAGVMAGLQVHNRAVGHQQNYNQNNSTGYGVTYEEGQRLYGENIEMMEKLKAY